MRVFMLGWEFPPFISGGLGTACYGLTRALSAGGTDVTFVLPRPASAPFTGEVRQPAHAATPRPSDTPSDAASGPSVTDAATEPATPPSVEFHLDEFRRVTFHAVASGITGPYQRPGGAAGGFGAGRFEGGVGGGRAGGPGFGSAAYAGAGSAPPSLGRSGGPGGVGPARPAPARGNVGPDPQPNPWSAGGPDPSASDVDPSASDADADAEADLFAEVERYAQAVESVAAGAAFDVVHAHDWMTFAAGAAVARRAGVPLVVHVHSTEADRTAGTPDAPDPRIVAAERAGVAAADRIIAVSRRTKAALVEQYGADPAKVDVVYNAPGDLPTEPQPSRAEGGVGLKSGTGEAAGDGADDGATEGGGSLRDFFAPRAAPAESFGVAPGDRIVAFVGRLTGQKGPEHFLTAAKRVLERVPSARFVLAGDGDLARPLARRAADLGIAGRVVFAGFLSSADVDRLLRAADVFVLPSVSDPFGIAALEAMARDVPTVVSRAAGVSEAVEHAVAVDLDDDAELSGAIIDLLSDPAKARALGERGGIEVRKMTWSDAADACLETYAAAGAA